VFGQDADQSPEEFLRKLARQESLFGDMDVRDLLREKLAESAGSGGNPPRSSKSNESASKTDNVRNEWIEFVKAGLSRVSKSRRKHARQRIVSTSIEHFDVEGEYSAACFRGDTSYVVSFWIDFQEGTYEYDCSCEVPNCVHFDEAMETLHYRLRSSDCELFDANHKSTPAPRTDLEASELLSKLDSVLDQSPIEPPAEFNEVAQPKRLLWSLDSDYLEVSARLQQAKKRGGGWTKGKNVSIVSLFQDPKKYCQQNVDRQIVGCIEESGPYYSRKLKLDTMRVLELLIGSDRFEVKGQPSTITRTAFKLVCLQHEDSLRIVPALINEDGLRGGMRLWTKPTGIIACLNDAIHIFRCPPVVTEFLRYVVEGPRQFPVSRKDELFERLERLREHIAVELPEQELGKVELVRSKPAVLLRSSEHGDLDIGLRVRDLNNSLALPGGRALTAMSTRGKKSIQLRRDADFEFRESQTLADDLGLHEPADESTPWNWRVEGIDNVFAFLSRLQQENSVSGSSESNSDEPTDNKSVPETRFEVVWDEQSVRRLNVMGTLSAQNVRVEITKKRDWFGLNGTAKIGDKEVPLLDLLKSMSGQRLNQYMEIQPGEWAKVTEEFRKRLEKLRDATHTNRKSLQLDATSAEAFQEFAQSDIDLKSTKAWTDQISRMERAKSLDPEPPISFNADLRDYQLQGYKWLRRLAEWGVGGVLADDMGLGKTVQMLAVMVDRIEEGPTLVIAPTSVGFNWQSECERFAPSLSPHLYRETDRDEFLANVSAGDVVICSYGLALRDAAKLQDIKWGTLVLDEAQFIKNSRSKTALAIHELQAEWKIALTGTPMENHLGELWGVYRAVSPGLFGSWDQFRNRFATPIEKRSDEKCRKVLASVLQPFMLRRTKSEVLHELPARTEINLHTELSADERRKYDDMRLAAVNELAEVEGQPETKDQRFRVLAMLTRLRQLSCHPRLLDSSWPGTSAKLELLTEKVLELKEEGHRALIFSQFTSHLALIKERMDELKVTYQYLDGKTPAGTRKTRVEQFQNGEGDVFLISLKAGGTGLNLTGADYVIHMDPWWNPAVEDQATDRAHRIGQTKPVIVYRLIAQNTIEEQILALHADKRGLVSGILDGTSTAAKLSTTELADLIRTTATTARANK
jgi:hypothetical protein